MENGWLKNAPVASFAYYCIGFAHCHPPLLSPSHHEVMSHCLNSWNIFILALNSLKLYNTIVVILRKLAISGFQTQSNHNSIEETHTIFFSSVMLTMWRSKIKTVPHVLTSSETFPKIAANEICYMRGTRMSPPCDYTVICYLSLNFLHLESACREMPSLTAAIWLITNSNLLYYWFERIIY